MGCHEEFRELLTSIKLEEDLARARAQEAEDHRQRASRLKALAFRNMGRRTSVPLTIGAQVYAVEVSSSDVVFTPRGTLDGAPGMTGRRVHVRDSCTSRDGQTGEVIGEEEGGMRRVRFADGNVARFFDDELVEVSRGR